MHSLHIGAYATALGKGGVATGAQRKARVEGSKPVAVAMPAAPLALGKVIEGFGGLGQASAGEVEKSDHISGKRW